MEKDDFILNVVGLQTILDNPNIRTTYGLDSDMIIDLIEDGYTISITAWHPNETHMIDQHITEFFPELENLGIEELMEGDMYYGPNIGNYDGQGSGLDLDTLVILLTNMGFNVSTDTLRFETPQQEDEEASVTNLRTQMNQAVGREDYEEAARLRDIIKTILRESFR